ncbi:testis-specific Y-encoded protein 9-like [Perognathus longimembris pacificus]|uniref:testis-specific Y-encoded protein 9-like n=1 Tax=Perognathus longimembris pacificus TaxID=214514 RepID=UPI0020199D8C|nr:testis-specific Y-encoded protein 9-like [Perognathus longimembris pacificus]
MVSGADFAFPRVFNRPPSGNDAELGAIRVLAGSPTQAEVANSVPVQGDCPASSTVRGECGTPPPAEEPPLKELQALQLVLRPVNNQATKAHERLKQNLSKRQKTLLDSRSSNIRGIPGFWAQTFVNHPQLSAMISDQDEDMLSYIINLEVQELRHPKSSCKITFYFRNNPYFQNAVVVKEFVVDITGYRLCHSTPIHWREDYKIEADSHRNHNKSPNFFNWFTDHNFAGSNRITEIIRKDLWLNSLYYYKMMKAST